MRTYKIVSFSVVILLITVLFAGVVTVPAAAAPTDTMQFHYNAQHTGDYSPVAGSVPSNGKLKWSYTTASSVESSPAVANGVVYVGSDDGNFYAVNIVTGQLKWFYATGSSVYSSPAVANGIVYVGSTNGNVYALNANDGSVKWSYATGSSVYSSPAVANGVVYVGSEDHNLYALNAATGQLKWKYQTGSGVYLSPAVVNGVVYVGSYFHNQTTGLTSGIVYALYANDGTQLWNYTSPLPSIVSYGPAVANGVVYVGITMQHFVESGVYALDTATGALKWKYATGNYVSSSPAVANGVVYVGSDDYKLYALDATTGAKKWSFPTGREVTSSPAVANGVVYFGSADGNLYALNAATGAKLWSFTPSTPPAVVSSPAVVNGVVYVGGVNGKLYAIGNQPTPTHITLTPSTTAPVVNQKVTFTATLNSGSTPLASKSVTIYHYLNGVRYTDTTKTSNAAGQITLIQSFGSAGKRTYYATFAGNSQYVKSQTLPVTVTVRKVPTATTLTASKTNPTVNQQVTFTAKLYRWNAAIGSYVPFANKQVTIWHTYKGVRYTDTTKTTNANGQIAFVQKFGSLGPRYYYATFVGDSIYAARTSSSLTITVH